MTQRQEVPCRDAIGRSRTAVVFGASFGRVAIQAPPGEVIVLTMGQLNELWLAAVSACRPALPTDGGIDHPGGRTPRSPRLPQPSPAGVGRPHTTSAELDRRAPDALPSGV